VDEAKGLEMHLHTPHLRRWIAASLVAAAVAAPAAQAGGPDDRALYRGDDPALAPTTQSPDDRALYRGGSDNPAPATVSPDDRPFVRSATEIEPGSPRVETIASATGFDWADAAIGSTFGAALALLAGGAALVANQRRRSLRSA
jgi:hypothetical protein